MAKAKRVFQIAKELGVASKSIVEKCRAEEVPGIVNHMSTVKVGLEATLNEWFSSGDSGTVAAATTAVETAKKVDIVKARHGVRRRNTTANFYLAAAPRPAGHGSPGASRGLIARR